MANKAYRQQIFRNLGGGRKEMQPVPLELDPTLAPPAMRWEMGWSNLSAEQKAMWIVAVVVLGSLPLAGCVGADSTPARAGGGWERVTGFDLPAGGVTGAAVERVLEARLGVDVVGVAPMAPDGKWEFAGDGQKTLFLGQAEVGGEKVGVACVADNALGEAGCEMVGVGTEVIQTVAEVGEDGRLYQNIEFPALMRDEDGNLALEANQDGLSIKNHSDGKGILVGEPPVEVVFRHEQQETRIDLTGNNASWEERVGEWWKGFWGGFGVKMAEAAAANTATAVATASATAALRPTETTMPTETMMPPTATAESVNEAFWEALKQERGDRWDEYLEPSPYGFMGFTYAVDGTFVSGIPIPGVEGAVAEMAVAAHYFDAGGERREILVAILVKLADGTLVPTGAIEQTISREQVKQEMEQYPSAYQVNNPGQVVGAYIDLDLGGRWTKEGFGELLERPGAKAYLRYVEANRAKLEEFLQTGWASDLKIIFPMAKTALGGKVNILSGK